MKMEGARIFVTQPHKAPKLKIGRAAATVIGNLCESVETCKFKLKFQLNLHLITLKNATANHLTA